ncbi:MAG: aldehyde dehydrogenase family protein [Rhodothermales bacterium]
MSVPPGQLVEDYPALLERQTERARTLRHSTWKTRVAKLRRLKQTLLGHREAIRAALWADFRKPAQEVDLTELTALIAEISHVERHLRRWMKPRRLHTPLPFIGTSAIRYLEPKGVVLVLAPWNYPLMLALAPVASAVAAGNCVVLKPSEFTPATSALIGRIVRETFDEAEVAVVEGGVETARALLELRFDHIYFTGNPTVGRLVMEAAARHLTSVTLELGGKSPAVVDASAHIEQTARRLAFGKFSNAGQTCIAPDYLLVQRSIFPALVDALKRAIDDFFGTDRPPLLLSGIVSERHLGRLRDLIEEAVGAGARVLHGGAIYEAERVVMPTLITDVHPESRLLTEEIFGPILPILPYDDLDEALAVIAGKPPALTLYVFSTRPEAVKRVRERTSTGSILVNDTLIQFSHPEMAFGGSHESGVGRSHGHAGFMAFSNERPVLWQHAGAMALFAKLYPPYNRASRWLQAFLLRWYGR